MFRSVHVVKQDKSRDILDTLMVSTINCVT